MKEQKVESVERALTILNAFSDGERQLSLAELSKRTGLYRSTILRLAESLARFGYIHRSADGQFSLGPTLWRLGNLYQSSFNLAHYVRPVLRELVEATGETSAFYIREGNKRVCLYRHYSPNPIRHHVDEGSEVPLNRASGSHVLVAFTDGVGAFYDDIKAKGYCIALGETDPATGGVSAPVFGGGGKLVGALGIAGLRDRFEGEKGESIVEILLAKSDQLSTTLSGR